MYILLPNSDNGYANVEDRLGQFGSSLFTGLSVQKFDTVSIPKWEFEQTMDGIKDFLKNLGVQTAFSASADLSGITDKESLAVSDVVHKAKIKVDEEVRQESGVYLGLSIPPPSPFLLSGLVFLSSVQGMVYQLCIRIKL